MRRPFWGCWTKPRLGSTNPKKGAPQERRCGFRAQLVVVHWREKVRPQGSALFWLLERESAASVLRLVLVIVTGERRCGLSSQVCLVVVFGDRG